MAQCCGWDPNRICLKLKDPGEAPWVARLTEIMNSIDGIRDFEADEETGYLFFHHNPDVLSLSAILETLISLGFEVEVVR